MRKWRPYNPSARGAIAALACAGMGIVACSVALGIDDVQLGDCHTGQLRCLDNRQPQTCNGSRHWQNAAPCDNQTCIDGRCQGVCLSGARQCAGSTPQQCQDDGQGWTDEAACPFVCRDGQCTGECVPSPTPTSCLNNTPRNCDNDGTWQILTPCNAQTCKDGQCIGECVAGTKRCAGTTPQLCDADGQWQGNPPLCNPATEVCEGGLCVQKCTPGDLRCDGNVSQFCLDTGIWQTIEVCNPCGDKGCDPQTGACTLPQTAEGQPCIQDSDQCTLVAACQNQMCAPTLQVKCVDAHPCSNASCNPATGLCASMDGASCDDNNACTMQSTCQGGACNPAGDHVWAHWKLPPPQPPWQRFTTVEYNNPAFEHAEVVFDNLTRLLWQRRLRSVDQLLMNWNEAKNYCDTLAVPGYPSGWRLPTRIELASLVDYSIPMGNPMLPPNPSIDTTIFPWPPSSLQNNALIFWSSSPLVTDPNQAWIVDFHGGYVYYDILIEYYNVRCVR